MKTVTRTHESDASGIVRVEVAVGAPHHDVEVVLVWRDAGTAARRSTLAREAARLGVLSDAPLIDAATREWSPDFFRRMAHIDPRDASALARSLREVRARRRSKKAPRL